MYYLLTGLLGVILGLLLRDFVESYKEFQKRIEDKQCSIPLKQLSDFLDKILQHYPMYWGIYLPSIKEKILSKILLDIFLRYPSDISIPDLHRIIKQILSRSYSLNFETEVVIEDGISEERFDAIIANSPSRDLLIKTIREAIDWEAVVQAYNRNPKYHSLKIESKIFYHWIESFSTFDITIFNEEE